MVKVIRSATTKQCECLNCGALLEYTKADVRWSTVKFNEVKGYIECPECEAKIYL